MEASPKLLECITGISADTWRKLCKATYRSRLSLEGIPDIARHVQDETAKGRSTGFYMSDLTPLMRTDYAKLLDEFSKTAPQRRWIKDLLFNARGGIKNGKVSGFTREVYNIPPDDDKQRVREAWKQKSQANNAQTKIE